MLANYTKFFPKFYIMILVFLRAQFQFQTYVRVYFDRSGGSGGKISKFIFHLFKFRKKKREARDSFI